jgi:hypothetical protein
MIEAYTGYVLFFDQIEYGRNILHIVLIDSEPEADLDTFGPAVAQSGKGSIKSTFDPLNLSFVSFMPSSEIPHRKPISLISLPFLCR